MRTMSSRSDKFNLFLIIGQGVLLQYVLARYAEEIDTFDCFTRYLICLFRPVPTLSGFYYNYYNYNVLITYYIRSPGIN